MKEKSLLLLLVSSRERTDADGRTTELLYRKKIVNDSPALNRRRFIYSVNSLPVCASSFVVRTSNSSSSSVSPALALSASIELKSDAPPITHKMRRSHSLPPSFHVPSSFLRSDRRIDMQLRLVIEGGREPPILLLYAGKREQRRSPFVRSFVRPVGPT